MKVCPLLKKPCIGKKCINCIEHTQFEQYVRYFQGYIKYKISELYCNHFKKVIRKGEK